MTTRGARIARGTTAAVVSTFVAVFFHGLAGGPVPAPVGLIACVVFSALVCTPLAGVALSRARLAAAVTLSQLLFHFLFLLFAGTANVGAGGGSTGGHVHGSDAIAAQLATLSAAPAHLHDSPMWFSHALAAVVTFAVLRYGELSLCTLVELARLTVRALVLRVPTPAPAARVRPLAARRHARALSSRILLSVLSQRGPPAVVNA